MKPVENKPQKHCDIGHYFSYLLINEKIFHGTIVLDVGFHFYYWLTCFMKTQLPKPVIHLQSQRDHGALLPRDTTFHSVGYMYIKVIEKQ